MKLGDPATKISEIAEKLGVDMIVMGNKGLGSTDSEIGHVGRKVLKLTSKPILFSKRGALVTFNLRSRCNPLQK